jgi:hypothetical protein
MFFTGRNGFATLRSGSQVWQDRSARAKRKRRQSGA